MRLDGVSQNSRGRNFNCPDSCYGATQYAVSACIWTYNALATLFRSLKCKFLSSLALKLVEITNHYAFAVQLENFQSAATGNSEFLCL
jgi:hypothetical protein